MCDKLASKFINVINPKFKSFSRPLLLAATVGMFTLVLTLSLFIIVMVVNTKTQVGSVKVVELDDFIAEVQPICIRHPLEVLSIYYVDGSLNSAAVRYSGCFVHDREGYPATSCTEIEASERLVFIDICATAYVSQADPDVCNCHSEQRSPSEVISVRYKTRPDVVTTLGAAFGYASFIELIVTLMVIVIMSKCGCIEKNDAYLKELIAEVTAAGENTAMEMVDGNE